MKSIRDEFRGGFRDGWKMFWAGFTWRGRRPNPYLGFSRDLGLVVAVAVVRGFWLWAAVAPIIALCIAYDIRLMWIDAGKRLRGEATERDRYEHGGE